MTSVGKPSLRAQQQSCSVHAVPCRPSVTPVNTISRTSSTGAGLSCSPVQHSLHSAMAGMSAGCSSQDVMGRSSHRGSLTKVSVYRLYHTVQVLLLPGVHLTHDLSSCIRHFTRGKLLHLSICLCPHGSDQNGDASPWLSCTSRQSRMASVCCHRTGRNHQQTDHCQS